MVSKNDQTSAEPVNRRELLKTSSAVAGFSLINPNIIGNNQNDLSIDDDGVVHMLESSLLYSGIPDGAPWLDLDPIVKYRLSPNALEFTAAATEIEQRDIAKSRRILAHDRTIVNQRNELVGGLLSNSSRSIEEMKEKYSEKINLRYEDARNNNIGNNSFGSRDEFDRETLLRNGNNKLPFLRTSSLTYLNYWIAESNVPHPNYEVLTEGNVAVIKTEDETKRVRESDKISIELPPINVDIFIRGDELIEKQDPRAPGETTVYRTGDSIETVEVNPVVSLHNHGMIEIVKDNRD